MSRWLRLTLATLAAGAVLLTLAAIWNNLPGTVDARLDRIERTVAAYTGDPRSLGLAMLDAHAILALHPRNARAHVVLARIALALGARGREGARAIYTADALRDAHALTRAALDLDPALAAAHRLEAHVCLAEDSLAAARRHADRAEALRPNVAATQILYADLAGAARDWQGCIHHAETAKLMGLDVPERVAAEEQLSVAWMELERPDRAESSYVAITRLVPWSPRAQHRHAEFLLRQGRYDEAIERASLAIALNAAPASRAVLSDAWCGRGTRLLLELGQSGEARACFEHALAADSLNANAWYGVAMVRRVDAERGRDWAQLAASGEALERALAIDPHHAQARFELDQTRAWLEAIARHPAEVPPAR